MLGGRLREAWKFHEECPESPVSPVGRARHHIGAGSRSPGPGSLLWRAIVALQAGSRMATTSAGAAVTASTSMIPSAVRSLTGVRSGDATRTREVGDAAAVR